MSHSLILSQNSLSFPVIPAIFQKINFIEFFSSSISLFPFLPPSFSLLPLLIFFPPHFLLLLPSKLSLSSCIPSLLHSPMPFLPHLRSFFHFHPISIISPSSILSHTSALLFLFCSSLSISIASSSFSLSNHFLFFLFSLPMFFICHYFSFPFLGPQFYHRHSFLFFFPYVYLSDLFYLHHSNFFSQFSHFFSHASLVHLQTFDHYVPSSLLSLFHFPPALYLFHPSLYFSLLILPPFPSSSSLFPISSSLTFLLSSISSFNSSLSLSFFLFLLYFFTLCYSTEYYK